VPNRFAGIEPRARSRCSSGDAFEDSQHRHFPGAGAPLPGKLLTPSTGTRVIFGA